ncbi:MULTISPECIES: hypothetical protein [Clostridium]|uniref:Uncharacterized protein n=1 Tax=Clostridium perfringens TaxID=1502 RepID=F8UNK6_CLOPF|nr:MULTISPECIES: hypothetical protein [Clostridium]AEJ34214.1 hypothetical protein CP4_3476 [Clostridium perfringens]AEP95022.1 hypothetical protein pNetB_00046 [Clostridium perfringens]AFV15052.1 hypothetical protein pNetB-NE10_46 [Clostridium perfringens]MBO3304642.1 hypothetical protein [Clostridium perfringens]MBO3307957.1 hypothetical protein [Clostridium perfringens]
MKSYTGILELLYIKKNNRISNIILFLGIYLGIIFLILSATVLALQQLS